MPERTRVYIAGASRELERVEWACEAAASIGYLVLSDWTRLVRKERDAGHQTDRSIPPKMRRAHAANDIERIERSDLFWLLVPREPSIGSWVETGHAMAQGALVLASGDYRASIFLELAHARFDDDAQALEWLSKELLR